MTSPSPDPIAGAVDKLLRAGLNDEDSDQPEAALNALAALGDTALPALLHRLHDQSSDMRGLVIDAIGRIRAPGAADALLASLRDPDEQVRLKVVQALGQRHERGAVAPLLQQFAADTDPQVRYECLTSLGLIGDPAATDTLLAGTGDRDPYVRMWAMDALCHMRDARAPELAIKLLNDGSEYVPRQVLQSCAGVLDTPDGQQALITLALSGADFQASQLARHDLLTYERARPQDAALREHVRSAARPQLKGPNKERAALLLGDIGDPAAVDSLIAALRAPQPLAQMDAAFQLGNIRDARAVPPLIEVLQRGQPLVAATAYDSLQRFADQGNDDARRAVQDFKGKTFASRLTR